MGAPWRRRALRFNVIVQNRRVRFRQRYGCACCVAVLALSFVSCGGGAPDRRDQSVATVMAPGCSDAVADTAGSQSADAHWPVGNAPFGIASAANGEVVFVAVNAADASQPGELVAMDPASGEVDGKVSVPPVGTTPQVLGGAAITHDGRLVLVAIQDGVAVFDGALVRSSDPAARLGTLRAASEAGTIHVAVSPDDRYAAATEEAGAAVTLFDLRAAIADRFMNEHAIGSVQVNQAPVGVAFTPDGRSLLVTSQTAGALSREPTPGTVSLIDVGAAVAGEDDAVRAVVPAGCNPVRLAVSPDGRTVWVTARSSNALLAFDIGRMRSDAEHALLGWVRVGPAPVGVALNDAGSVAVVANSNRFDAPSQPSTISVIDTASVLEGEPRTIRTFTSGGFPREVAITPKDVAVVTDFGTMQLTVIRTLPTG